MCPLDRLSLLLGVDTGSELDDGASPSACLLKMRRSGVSLYRALISLCLISSSCTSWARRASLSDTLSLWGLKDADICQLLC